MGQEMLNWIFGLANIALGAFIKWIYDSHKELRDADKELTEKVSKIEVLVAGQYITREEFDRVMRRIFDKLDHIEAKIK